MLELELRDRIVSTKNKAFIVGILNATDDSFYEKSRGGIERAFQLIEEGADILDIGAESTRPGFTEVSAEDEIRRLVPIIKEIRRLVPIIKEIRKKSDIPISIDTRKLDVIKVCVAEGADIWNDITALGKIGKQDAWLGDEVYGKADAEKADFVAETKIPVILTHTFPFERERFFDNAQNDMTRPKQPEQSGEPTDIISTVSGFFQKRISFLTSHGIEKSKIILDPGIGFGKTFDENITLIKQCGKICGGEYQIMMACSRKRCIGEMIGDMNADRLEGTIQANIWAIESGAKFVRVHDVMEHIARSH